MPTTPTPTDRRARAAVSALFLTNGALMANLLPRLPEIKAHLVLSNLEYGAAIAAVAGGALIAGPAAGFLIRRFRSARLAVGCTVLIAAAVTVAAAAPNAVVFAAALGCAGAADAVTDVAQNAHGLRVQRRYGRSIINSLHAVWSAGAVLGGLTGTAAIAVGLAPVTQVAVAGTVCATLSLAVYRMLLSGPDGASHAPAAQQRSRVWRVYPKLTALVLLALAGAVIEDVGNSWATLYLREVGAASAVAPLGYVALVGCQLLGRLLGDRLVDRFGARAVTGSGGLLITLGMGTALAWPTVGGMIAGFAAAGLGVATVVPAAMHGADELAGLAPGTGLTAVNWLMRAGFLLSPPLIGSIADTDGLRAGLLVAPAAGLLVSVLAPVLTGRPTTGHSHRNRRADNGRVNGE
ncbi:MFS transporter [Mycolicibacillus trivialis]|uniref:Fucose permease n=1 Tax=Mycolicibacillus trivialis TaxID=1798 RepID=A0A1X2EQZ6_9MYCO|nr:MFS transporter [Mycolicibacillus trivialis]ORX08613.1 fucose permease [Mycolicibacillus trivialis]